VEKAKKALQGRRTHSVFAVIERQGFMEGWNVDMRYSPGRLTLVLSEHIDESARSRIRDETAPLSPWIDRDVPVATADDLLDASLRDPAAAVPEFIDHAEFRGFVRLVEHRIVGQDWLRRPQEPIPGVPPVVVFASHKGGVGRSTALAVTTMALSQGGYNNLVIDLDLEAPGLGQMFLTEDPPYGTLDYFVESGVADLDDAFFDSLVAASKLVEDGLIHVVPAVGSIGDASPQNILGKIARAYLERIGEDGRMISFLDRTRDLVRRLCLRNRYDVVFVDSRAGLNEAAAAAILGLGAEVLLFGVDTPQTFAGYRYLLA
jgi:MinD-like ATPase involved in chromosome partitioning or flagellar assembly